MHVKMCMNIPAITGVYFIYSDTLVIDAVVGHGDLSSAEAYDVTVTFYFPLVLSYHQIAYTNFTSPAVSKVGLYGVAFKVRTLLVIFGLCEEPISTLFMVFYKKIILDLS